MKIHTLIMLVLAACLSAYAQTPTQSRPSLDAIYSSGRPRTVESRLDASAKRALAEKAIKLKRGDNYQSVTNALGVPALVRAIHMSGGGNLIFSTLIYSAVKWKDGEFNEVTDEGVTVMLDLSDRVTWVRINMTLE